MTWLPVVMVGFVVLAGWWLDWEEARIVRREYRG